MPREKRVTETRRVGIWIRVSTEDQARGESPEHHEKRARYYAESKDWQVETVYHLEGVSGKSVLSHPEAQRMLSDVREGRISALIFSKIARLARNTRELLDLADEFERNNADLVSLQESIDTSTPAGRLFYTVIAALAEWERAEIATRVAHSVPVRAKLGKPLGGAAPFGYRWVDKRLILDEKEAPVRRLLYELFAEHQRKRTVARLVNDAGHRTRSGAKFAMSTIDRLITDPIAKGIRRANYRRATENGWEVKKPSDWVYVDAPPIVSAELWETCNEIMRSQKSPSSRKSRKPVHLFAGLVLCHCGPKMYVRWQGRSYTCSGCRNRVNAEDLEAVFIEQLRGFALSPVEVVKHLEAADRRISEKQELLKTLEAERSGVGSEMEKVYRLYVGDRISDQLFAERNGPLEERLRQLEDEIPKLQAEVDVLKLQVLSSDEVLAEARDLYARWPNLPFEDRRRIVEAVTDRILVGDNEITVHLAYLPHPPPSLPPSGRKDDAKRPQTLRDSWRRPARTGRESGATPARGRS
jgi:site-specific DNA recombinase